MLHFDRITGIIRTLAGADRLSLRAKLIGGFITVVGLAVLVGVVSLWSQRRALETIETYFGIDDRIADLSIKSSTSMLKARKYEKDFLLKVREFGFFEARSRYATLLQTEIEEIRRNMEAIRSLSTDPNADRQAREIENAAGRYEAGFLQVVGLYGSLGFVDTGLEGKFRSKAHEIESLVTRYRNDLLMRDLLSLRRSEKDFILRGLDLHRREFARDVNKFKGDIAGTDLPPAQKEKIVRLADDYRSLFEQYAGIKAAIFTETAAYLAAVQAVEPLLEKLYAASAQAALKTRTSVQRLARTSGWSIVGASAWAILAGGIVAFLISRKIMRSMSRTMVFARSIAHGELKTRMVPEEESEFRTLAVSLNSMADALQNASEEQRKYEAQLERQANYDELTDLPNRNLLMDRLRHALASTRRTRQEVAVLFLDLDHFKRINDGFGHDVGDRFLQLVAHRLLVCIRVSDTVAHYAGDKFVLILPGQAKSEYASSAARRILDAFSQPFRTGDYEIIISCSIGISVYPQDGEDEQTLLRNADAAMYRAKDQGRDTFQFYTKDLNDRIVERVKMERHLRRAMEYNELFLHYQPQVDLNSGRITGMESLLRWQNPDLGMVSPARFIPLAEETGLIVPIGEWVLKTSCEQNKAWQAAGLPPLTIAVNLSARQFWRHDLIGMVSRVLKDSGLEPRWLELEITESMVMRDVEGAAAMVRELKALGMPLAMDDFGTGYSSLSNLKRFTFDKLKIDLSFVREITSDPVSAAIAKTIISMAHNLNLRVIAEGVETKEQFEYLRGYGCDEMQGYYFSKPVPSPEFERLLRENLSLGIQK